VIPCSIFSRPPLRTRVRKKFKTTSSAYAATSEDETHNNSGGFALELAAPIRTPANAGKFLKVLWEYSTGGNSHPNLYASVQFYD